MVLLQANGGKAKRLCRTFGGFDHSPAPWDQTIVERLSQPGCQEVRPFLLLFQKNVIKPAREGLHGPALFNVVPFAFATSF